MAYASPGNEAHLSDPYAGLIVALIRQALKDGTRPDEHGIEARQFLDSPDVSLWGGLLGLDADVLTARIRATLGEERTV